MRWHPRNKLYYTKLGYTFTKIGDEFLVKVEHLTIGAKPRVKIQCDYCGSIFTRRWQNHINQYNKDIGDACDKCKKFKTRDSMLKNYGVENPFMLEDVKEKIAKTCFETYGVYHYSQSQDMKERMSKLYNSPEYRKKRRWNIRTSYPQIRLRNLLIKMYGKCELNYPCDRFFLDCVIEINNVKIDIEYDCMHWHQNEEKDKIRNIIVQNNGYKVLRIKTMKEFPQKESLEDKINILINTNKIYEEIVLDV